GERAVAHAIARRAQAIVRVVSGPVRERQELAAARVEDHQSTGLGLVRLHCGLQLAEGEILQTRVDGQREVAPFLRRADAGDVFHRLAAAVDDHATAPRLAAEPFLLPQLHAFLADVVIAGEAEDVTHAITARIITAVL